jgi:hypothetical protein
MDPYLAEFIYQLIIVIESNDIAMNAQLIALAIISKKYSTRFASITQLSSNDLATTVKILREIIKSLKETYDEMNLNDKVIDLVYDIYLELGIDIALVPMPNMYKMLNKKFQPLVDILDLDNIEKYEFDVNHTRLTVYTTGYVENDGVLNSDGSLMLCKIDSTTNEFSELIQKINLILNKDSHHC